jgi:hypothetical protein
MVGEHRLSIARACRAAKLSRAAYYRQGIDWAKRDAPVIDALNTVVEKHGRWGGSATTGCITRGIPGTLRGCIGCTASSD